MLGKQHKRRRQGWGREVMWPYEGHSSQVEGKYIPSIQNSWGGQSGERVKGTDLPCTTSQ